MRATALLVLVLVAFQAAPADRVVVTDRMHHLRSGPEREWAEFPIEPEGGELRRTFRAAPNVVEHTLRLRHRDLKGPWRVLLNDREIARLPPDDADTITYWAVPPDTLKAGDNQLRIHATGATSDDVQIGEVSLIAHPRDQVLSEATVDVSVLDADSGRSVPSRITVADENGTLVTLGNTSGPQHAIRPGVVYTATGSLRLKLPRGRYVLYASRGFEWSVASGTVDLRRRAHAALTLRIRRDVDTAGWAAMDTHLHTGTFARHGDASIAERMLTIAGEGIELAVSTEHDTRVDFDAAARAAGVREHFTPVLGTEVTTPVHGHFNVFPVPRDSNSIDRTAGDWNQLRDGIERAAGKPIVVLNHGRDVHGGFRPLDPARHVSIAGEDLEGRSLPANAMEVVNSGAVLRDPLMLPLDWMGMLNRGIILTPVGASDSHDVSRYIVGQGRTYVRVDDSDPARIDVAAAVDRIRSGQVTVSYGLLVEIDVAGEGPGELVAPAEQIDVRLRVKGPGWTRARRVALYVNGAKSREEEIASGTEAGVKWEATWRLPTPPHDVHLAAIATGPGVAAPHWRTAKPYQPTSIEFTPYVLGATGAVFVDADRSGRFDSAYDYARRAVSIERELTTLAAGLGRYDTAVAIQAASVLRAQDPAAFEGRIRSLAGTASAHVAEGLLAYLDAWKNSQRRSNVP